MSGGAFEYKQYQLMQLVEELDTEMKDYKEYKEDEEIREVIYKHFKDAKRTLKKAYVYLQRFDYLFSGDDGIESFLKRLREELEQCDTE